MNEIDRMGTMNDTVTLVTIPKDGRLSLARFGFKPRQKFLMSTYPDGTIVLRPADE